jgi:hypothetical protein
MAGWATTRCSRCEQPTPINIITWPINIPDNRQHGETSVQAVTILCPPLLMRWPAKAKTRWSPARQAFRLETAGD